MSEVEVQAEGSALLYCGANYTDWRCNLAPFLWANRYLYVRPTEASEA
jgi:hypothetical protein